MSKKMYWGLGVLIILFGTAFVFMMLRTNAENRQLEKELADLIESKKNKTEQPRQARPGYKWVQHDDHYHEVRIEDKPAEVIEVPNKTPDEVQHQLSEEEELALREYELRTLPERIESLKALDESYDKRYATVSRSYQLHVDLGSREDDPGLQAVRKKLLAVEKQRDYVKVNLKSLSEHYQRLQEIYENENE